ncbi:MAG: iron-siderophore ABC transporter substrate-binding protein [Bacillota bacterium]|nr:iron-siderophore ABC transporter substrate-binding protein [Bacillota bacterium]MDW7684474.1 iron-siderophore ABC transporter substrate-binding protein [Bacillota bacterium]
MKKIFGILLVLLMVTVTACSPQPSSNETGNTDSEPGNPLIISGVLGEVELAEPAKKVVALEWTYAENLLAVGIQPIGVADIGGYNSWVQIEEKLSENVADVGTRQEPSLEKIAELEPDLIIAIKFRHESIKSQLESIAPTIFFDPYPSDESFSQYSEMEETFKEIAKAVGKTAEAEQILTELERTYEDAKAAIEAANLTTKDVLLTQAFSANQAPQIRVFTPNSLASGILKKIGLNNIHTPAEFQAYGFSTVNVEALTHYESANYLYVVQDSDNIYENQLKDNSVWNGLAFVKEQRTYPLGGDAWLFGGPLSAKVVVNRILNVLVEN